ncbi:hypothetical protein [Novosphingobium taihuense]|uniref:DUF1214 domain-containing protein n=1 Tax=Novosphingobium taihuense TaxID=260085 RepID=A0A7W7AE92_9SPHN|nr:hypothetical protein [Novosphingobium taihuense]MBB4615430.1 hypothetical protein [Novosphingobium taihuense]
MPSTPFATTRRAFTTTTLALPLLFPRAAGATIAKEIAMSQSPAVPMDWPRFIELIRGVDKTLEYVIDPQDAWLKQEAIQQMAMSLAQGYMAIFHSDPQHPVFYTFLNPIIKSAAPNPDYMYRSSFIEGHGTYRISGKRGTTLFVHIGIGSGYIGVDDVPGPSVGDIDLDTLTIGKDGSFSLILAPERPEGYTGDFYQLDPNARTVGIREASYDWINEVDSTMAIERLDGPATYRRWPIDEIAYRLERLAGFPERYAKLFVHFVQTLRQNPVNTVTLNDWASIGGLKDQTYYEGLFEFAEGECLLLETDVPERVRYWQVLLADQLFNSIEWDKCQSSLNGFQAQRYRDGKFRAVICNVDPGVPNWLDTAGRFKGVVQGRWYQASSAPHPTIKRIKLSELRDHLPTGTPVVDEATRKERLLERFRGAQFRKKW